jgi:hypothetical protein
MTTLPILHLHNSAVASSVLNPTTQEQASKRITERFYPKLVPIHAFVYTLDVPCGCREQILNNASVMAFVDANSSNRYLLITHHRGPHGRSETLFQIPKVKEVAYHFDAGIFITTNWFIGYHEVSTNPPGYLYIGRSELLAGSPFSHSKWEVDYSYERLTGNACIKYGHTDVSTVIPLARERIMMLLRTQESSIAIAEKNKTFLSRIWRTFDFTHAELYCLTFIIVIALASILVAIVFRR